ncbi:hypothetical protein KGQ20_03190 [Catenulispora sp. NF23]|uniref:Uncharacterized protein n=1 Tax=Catenulispora pinistramenti TaxID=2705254 RepID=A0ABS5KY07_9ACTN|nr:hypothetical protein [Catenulispora pinistramenti]MBS2531772.1 hypothetical protein [Catenulispora pinistramenti]MBS2550938.1 hypothetical protein [Catenulispora pinistramenti]
MKELDWRPAVRVVLVDEGEYPVHSVAFAAGWVFAKNEHGTVAFPSSQVIKVSLG